MRARRILIVALLVGGAVVLPEPSRSTDAATTPNRLIGNDLSNGPSQVVAVEADRSGRRKLVEGHSADQTADGRRLVYLAGDVLHVADGDGSDSRPLGDGTVTGREPRWSPDGSRITYTIGSFERPAIAVVGSDGTGATVITAGSSADWSPDGTSLAFVANERIWTVPARPGAAATAITEALPFLNAPRWSPDGSTIGFGGWCVGVVHPDGSGERCLGPFGPPGSAGRYQFAGWAPDSRHHASYWTGFHQWSGTRWTDPATGEAQSLGSLFFVTDWAGAAGPTPCRGYRLLGRDGGVFTFGAATFHGSTGGMRLNRPVLGMTATASGGGYWLAASDGGVFTYGDAPFHGSAGALPLKAPVVGMARTPSGGGYWLVASDGGIFTYGDAGFHGSTGALALKAPIVGMVPTASGGGYWLVASDGGIFTFGDAGFHGSTGALELAQPIVGMARTGSGAGYALVGRDGGTFTFGDAGFTGSLVIEGHTRPPVTAVSGTAEGLLLTLSTGEVAALGGARFCGSTKHLRLAASIVGVAA